MSTKRKLANASAAFSTVGLLGISAIHFLWASGSPWPAKSQGELAEMVVGNAEDVPTPASSAVVAVGAAGAALGVAGVGGQSGCAVNARRLVGVGLLARGVLGGAVALRALGASEPGRRFRELDRTFYRPLCLVLGGSVLAAARRPPDER
ncbi:DUF3995 domain-containing protein [Spiractinospora alimapuensis]|uniref:DUF3995 domain-containing protein n=1 Tax=Spiractinospora alimapuensis TaxID=2820884 RepID=UPI001F3FB16B|nr:DUF3995 domain-containing protein [Spiractinospora alimapuensis]QVQ50192.1 DUF3995 domain-containing protein [Spiractinospora alimapuensis]